MDPIIATGGTAATVVAILKEWGVAKIIFTSVLASSEGIERAANEWPEGFSRDCCLTDRKNTLLRRSY